MSNIGLAHAFAHLKRMPINCHTGDVKVDEKAKLAAEAAQVQAALAKAAAPVVIFEAQDNERYLVIVNGVSCMVTHASKSHALALANYAETAPKSHNERNFWFVGPQAAKAALQAVQS